LAPDAQPPPGLRVYRAGRGISAVAQHWHGAPGLHPRPRSPEPPGQWRVSPGRNGPQNPEFSCSHRRLRSVSMKTASAAGLLLLAVVLAGCRTDGYAEHPRLASNMIAQVGHAKTGESRVSPVSTISLSRAPASRAHHLAGGQDGELAGRPMARLTQGWCDAASLTHDVIVNEGDGRQADFFASQGIVEIMLPFSPAAMLILSFEGSHSHSVIRARRYQRRH
jgi:hypothetical protein